jgi:ABC-2 type transport system permease protein
MRPVDLHSYWMSRMLATRLAPTFLRAGPIIVFAAVIGQMLPPASVAHLLLAVISIGLGMLLATAIYSLVTISLLWTVAGEGAARLAPSLVFFLSGMIIPVPLFPAWAQPILNILPFRGLIDTPFRIYLGNMTIGEAGLSMVQQVIWIGVFVIAGRWLLGRGLRRLVVQGG